MTEATVKKHSSTSPDYSRFLHVYGFYQDVCTRQFVLPASLTKQLPNPAMLQKALQLVQHGDPNMARQVLSQTQFGLAPALEQSLKLMLETVAYMSMPDARKNSYDTNRENFLQHASSITQLQEECLKLTPNIAEFWHNFGLANIKLDRVEEGVECLQKALELSPYQAKTHACLALIYTQCHAWERGLHHARQAFAANEELDGGLIDMCLSTCSYKLGLPAEGLTRFVALEEHYPVSVEAALAFFPPVDTASLDHSAHDKPVIYLPCDAGYFIRHGLALICSIHKHSPDYAIHVHLFNPDAAAGQALETVRKAVAPVEIYLSEEGVLVQDYTTHPGNYFSTIRDCRLYQLVAQNPHRFIRLDVDILLNKPIETLPINDKDMALGVYSDDTVPFWEMIAGGVYSFKRSEASLDLLKKLTLLIEDNFRTCHYRWFSGQLLMSVLYETYLQNRDDIFCPMRVADSFDVTHREDATLWTVTSDKKSCARYLCYKHDLLREYGLESYIPQDEVVVANTV